MGLSALEVQLLRDGAKRCGLTAEQLDALVSGVAAGTSCRSTPDIPGFGQLPVPVKGKPSGNFVLAYDPEIVESYSSGWVGKQQRSAARLDGRDVRAVFPQLWIDCSPYVWQLPARLALNVLVADIAHTGGTGDFVRELAAWGLLQSSDNFENLGKRLSLAAKGREDWLDNPEWFVEVNVLVGCRYPDSESARRVSDEIRASAPVEIKPGAAAWQLYKKEGRLQRFAPAAQPLGLREYVASLSWKTDGSASMSGLGGLKFTADDATGVIRLTKALVPFVADFDELVSSVANLAGCESVIVKTVIKLGETSKDRVIYPYALSPTIAKAFLLSHIKGNANYPLSNTYITNRLWRTSLGESGWSEVFRQLRTLSLASPLAAGEALEAGVDLFALAGVEFGAVPDLQTVDDSGHLVCLASDVKGFDKQVGESYSNEFWATVRQVVPELSWNRVAGNRVGAPFKELILPVDRELEYAAVHDRVELERTADFNTLSDRASTWLVQNKAYLTSGTLETTKVGNRVSYIANRIAAILILKLSPGSIEMFDVRGDDQLAVLRGRSALHALAVAKLWWVATSAFFEYSPEKSRMSAGADRTTEFLRIDYSRLGARGYLNRCLVWITEARPLSSETGYRYAAKAVSGLQQVSTAMRRGSSEALRRLMYVNATRALASVGVPAAFLHAPAAVGGAGVLHPLPFQFSSVTVPPRVVTAPSAWSISLVAARYADYAPTPEETFILTENELSTIVSASDSPEVRSNTRVSRPSVTELQDFELRTIPALSEIVQMKPLSSFGSMRGLESDVEKASAVARVRGVSMVSLLDRVSSARLRDVEKRLKLPRRLAVEWLSGKVSGHLGDCHPELVFIVVSLCSRLLSQRIFRTWDARTSYYVIASYFSQVSAAVYRALKTLYMW